MSIKNSVLFEIVATPSGIVDLAGGGFTNTNVGYSGTGVYGGSNRCLTFDATTISNTPQCIDLTNPITLSGDFTISFWAYATHNNTNFLNTIGDGNTDDENRASISATIGNTDYSFLVLLQHKADSKTKIIMPSIDFGKNKWNHYAITRHDGEFYFFVNGSTTSQGNFTTSLTTETLVLYALRIGQASEASTDRNIHPQYMDDVCIMNEALWTSDFDVPTDYVGLVPRSNTNKIINNFRIGSI